VAVFYADTSALVKLVRRERETNALLTYLDGADLVSSELVLTEIPRAIRRAAALDPSFLLEPLLSRSGELIDALALRPVDCHILLGAGALAEPALRALDAIHIASAVSLSPVDAFVSYDDRQTAAARLAGLRTMTPVETA
jgi:predicted nucleic acid-binding protein